MFHCAQEELVSGSQMDQNHVTEESALSSVITYYKDTPVCGGWAGIRRWHLLHPGLMLIPSHV